MAKPKDKKRLQPAVGAGGRLDFNQMAIIILTPLPSLSSFNAPVVLQRSLGLGSAILLLNGMASSPKELTDRLEKWEDNGLVWVLANQDSLDAPDLDVSNLLDEFMSCGAYGGATSLRRGLILTPPQAVVNEVLANENYSESCEADVGEPQWFLTSKALRNMSASNRLCNPSKVFNGIGDLPLEDASSWQLLDKLDEDGWTLLSGGQRPVVEG